MSATPTPGGMSLPQPSEREEGAPVSQEQRIAALEARIAALEQQAKLNAPAMRAAWMHVPIGGRR